MDEPNRATPTPPPPDGKRTSGKLKVFFGAAPGVGKTYAMVDAARKRSTEGSDVVVGSLDTRRRPEIELLLAVLERLPTRTLTGRGGTRTEFDLDAALQRHPHIIVLDDLAHTNAPGQRNARRWQDVQELLLAGIDVYTTLNVTQLESVNDIVSRITGVTVPDPVPDSLFDEADEVELVDMTPDDLLQRWREGRIHITEGAPKTLSSMFRKGSLIALRELTLRRMAERVESQMESFRQEHAPGESWPVVERLVVAISPSPYARRVVRAARRMAVRSHAQWIAAYVETPESSALSAADRNRVYQTLRLAERLGAETVTVTGDNVAQALIEYAVRRNATRIVVGKPGRAPWRDRFFGSMVDELIRNEAGIDVTIIRGQLEETGRESTPRWRRPGRALSYLEGLGVVALCTLLAWPLALWFGSPGVAMLYLLGVALVAMWRGIGPSLAASLLGLLAFDFLFTTPRFQLHLNDSFLLFTFFVMVVVGNVIGSLALRIKSQANIARRHEERVTAMYQLTRDLADADQRPAMVDAIIRNITASFGGDASVLLPNDDGRLISSALTESALSTAQWVLENGRMAGLGTDVLSSTDLFFLPLKADRATVGVLAIRPRDRDLVQNPEQMLLLETLCRHAALAIEHDALVHESQNARMAAEAERLQNILLSSVSHDLRTPLASITGAASSLLDSGSKLTGPKQTELLATIHDEADRLNRLVTNLLHVTRLESGALKPNKDWQSVEELVGAALNRLDKSLAQRQVNLQIPLELPLVSVDGILLEQVLFNLLDNAIKYTPAGSPIDIEARAEDEHTVITIADRGPGFGPGEAERVFEKFFQGGRANAAKGAGLGLTVCRGFVEAHGGTLRAFNRDGGGAVFEIVLPSGGKSPKIDLDFSERSSGAAN